MVTFQVGRTDKGVYAKFKGPHINKELCCPEKRAKKIEDAYYAEKFTTLKYNIPVLHVDGKVRTCHELMHGRIWNTLWEEGWRKK